MLQPSTVVGGYTVHGVLGRGGMGVVYRAHHAETGRDVALKVLAAELGEAPPAARHRHRGRREVQQEREAPELESEGSQGRSGTDGTDGTDGTGGSAGAAGRDRRDRSAGHPGSRGTRGAPGGLSTATIAVEGTSTSLAGTPKKVMSKVLPAGNYAIVSTVQLSVFNGSFAGEDYIRTANCQLRKGSSVIGGASDRRVIIEGDSAKRNLTLTGGAAVSIEGAEISVWCDSQAEADESFSDGQIMALKVGAFS